MLFCGNKFACGILVQKVQYLNLKRYSIVFQPLAPLKKVTIPSFLCSACLIIPIFTFGPGHCRIKSVDSRYVRPFNDLPFTDTILSPGITKKERMNKNAAQDVFMRKPPWRHKCKPSDLLSLYTEK